MPKEVLFLLTNHFTHDSRVLKEGRSLVEAGYKVTLRCFYDEGLAKQEYIDGINVERVMRVERNKRKGFALKIYLLFLFIFKSSVRTKKFNYIHAHDLKTLPTASLIKLIHLNKQKIIYDCHEYETEVHRPNRWSKPFSKVTERLFIRFADKVIVVSDSIGDEYVRLYKVEKPTLVMNCPSYSAAVKKDFFRERFGIRKNQIIFLYQGALSNARGTNVLIDAFKDLPTDKQVVIFMGFGETEKKIQEIASQSKNVYMHEAVTPEVLHEYTCSADVGICYIKNSCLNYYYCLPNKLFEYAMADLPVISSDLFELNKFCNIYYNGWVTPEGDAGALNDIVLSITEKMIKDKKKNLEKIKSIYNWEEQEKVLIALYNDLAMESKV